MKDSINNIQGHVNILHYNEKNELIKEYSFKNLVVTTGLNWITDRLNTPAPAVMNYIAVGTDNTLPAANQTTLVSEIYRESVAISGGTVSNNTLLFTITLGPGEGTGALQEAGIFDLASAGTMLSRVTYPVINKGAGDTIAISWTISIGS